MYEPKPIDVDLDGYRETWNQSFERGEVHLQDRLHNALLCLLRAFPDLGRGFSTAEQQIALREAYAALEQSGVPPEDV